MRVIEINNVVKEDGYIYYIHHYKGTAVVEFLARQISLPIVFTIEINPLGMRSIDLEPLPRDLDYPVMPLSKALKEFIDQMDKNGLLPQTE